MIHRVYGPQRTWGAIFYLGSIFYFLLIYELIVLFSVNPLTVLTVSSILFDVLTVFSVLNVFSNCKLTVSLLTAHIYTEAERARRVYFCRSQIRTTLLFNQVIIGCTNDSQGYGPFENVGCHDPDLDYMGILYDIDAMSYTSPSNHITQLLYILL